MKFFLHIIGRASGKYALVYASFHCLRWKLAAIVVPRLCLIGFNYSQPFLIASAIKHVSQPDGAQEKNDGYGLIAAAGLIYLGIAVSIQNYHPLYSIIVADLPR